MHICVLGAGVIGVTSAYRLLQAGHHVTLIDAQDKAAQMTSLGNGAQLSYSYVAPLADPSVWTKWPYYLFNAESPLSFRPRLDLSQWKWLWQFLSACNERQVKQTTRQLLQLAFLSRDGLACMQAEAALKFSHSPSGKLVMFGKQAELDAAAAQVKFQAQFGCEQQVLDAKACQELEPSLSVCDREWAGGVYTPSEAAGDCPEFCAALMEHMLESSQFRFLSGSAISGGTIRGDYLYSVSVAGQSVDADCFVLAMGVESAGFARKMGFHLPIYPLKGYSITVPVASEDPLIAPKVSITDASRKIVYARLGNRLRVAGRVEIVGNNLQIPDRAVQELIDGTRELFPYCGDLSDASQLSPWAGLRPATPTGLPIIGNSPVKNLYLNVGHGALGWTLACGSAVLLQQLLDRKQPSIDAQPYAFH